MSQQQADGRAAARTTTHARGADAHSLGFALRALGADRVLEELRTQARFGARCRRRATVALDCDERAAWAVLADAGPRAIERRLERDGLVQPTRRRSLRRAEARTHWASPGGRGATSGRGRAEFGSGADRTPFQEQLAQLALALAEAA